MYPPIPAEALRRLAVPFLKGGARKLYFASVENRVYCGKIRPTATKEGGAPPPAITLDVPDSGEIREVFFSDLAIQLMRLRDGEGE